MSGVLFNMEVHQGLMVNQDILESCFNLVNDAVIVMNAGCMVTKMNKSAEIILNTDQSVAAGKHISELLSPGNSHLFDVFKE